RLAAPNAPARPLIINQSTPSPLVTPNVPATTWSNSQSAPARANKPNKSAMHLSGANGQAFHLSGPSPSLHPLHRHQSLHQRSRPSTDVSLLRTGSPSRST